MLSLFQFLIGRLETVTTFCCRNIVIPFQFLIGRLETIG